MATSRSAAGFESVASAVANAPHKPTASRVIKSHAGAKVVVASKLTNAQELFLEMKTTQTRRYQGSVWTEEVNVPVPDGVHVVVAGTNYPIGAPPPGIVWPDRPRMAHGAALTFNVDKDFWDIWYEAHKTTPMIKNHLLAAFDTEADARAWAREYQKADSGLNPLVPDNDRRWPRKVTAIEARKSVEESAEVE